MSNDQFERLLREAGEAHNRPAGPRLDVMWDRMEGDVRAMVAKRAGQQPLDRWYETWWSRTGLEGWRAIRRRIALAGEPEAAPPSHLILKRGAGHRRAVRGWLAAAATVTVVAGGLLVRRMHDARVSASSTRDREYATAWSERAKLMLKDSTRVWLNVNSRLRVPAGYGTTARDVELDGEAYFIVKHDGKRPFRVHSHGTVLEDLGTEFSVRGYARDRAVRVVVTEGKVSLGRKTVQAILSSGDLATLKADDVLAVQHHVDVESYLGWVDRRLAVNDQPVGVPLNASSRVPWQDDLVREDSMKLLHRSIVAIGLAVPAPVLGQALTPVKPADLVGITWVTSVRGTQRSTITSKVSLYITFNADGTLFQGNKFQEKDGHWVTTPPLDSDDSKGFWKLVGDTLMLRWPERLAWNDPTIIKERSIRIARKDQQLLVWDLADRNQEEACAREQWVQFDPTHPLTLSKSRPANCS